MKYRVIHTTEYTTSTPVSVCHSAAWLTPRRTDRQRVEQHTVEIEPQPSTRDTRPDFFGNLVTHFSLNEGYEQLRVTASSVVTVEPLVQPAHSAAWETIIERMDAPATPGVLEVLQFRFDSPRVHRSPAAEAFARRSFPAGRPIVEGILDLTSRIHHEFEYDSKATTVTTPVSEVLEKRCGVCQDFAHVQIGMLRSLGLAARYVSGYVRTYPPPGQARLVGADASHAWLSVYCGEIGWLDIDPTNDKLAGDEHVTLSWGRDYGDVTPLKGVYTGGGKHALNVSVDVAPMSD